LQNAQLLRKRYFRLFTDFTDRTYIPVIKIYDSLFKIPTHTLALADAPSFDFYNLVLISHVITP